MGNVKIAALLDSINPRIEILNFGVKPKIRVPDSVPSNSSGSFNDSAASGITKLHYLRLVYANCRSLNNKVMELEHTIVEESAKLVSVTETWFIPGNELKIVGYDGFYCSRRNRKGGGLAIYVESSISNRVQVIESDTGHEFNFVIIKLQIVYKALYIGVFYLPPNLSWEETSVMCEIIRSLSGKDVLVMGDFNLPGIDWNSHNIPVNCIKSKESELFLDVMDDLFLYQHVHEPTRHGAGENSIVDLVFSMDETLISDIRIFPPLSGSDHSVLIFDYRMSLCTEHSKILYLYKNTNDTQVQFVYEKWKPKLTFDNSVETIWKKFYIDVS